MRKQQYIAAVACLVAGTIGFVSVYATEKGKERKEQEQQILQETQQLTPASYEVKPENTASKTEQTEKVEPQETVAEETTAEQEKKAETAKSEQEEKTAAMAAQDTLHFDKNQTQWPIEGEILLDYSMDKTIYFPTLEQYRYNPAMVIQGAVNDKVKAAASGKITKISENEETGCTVWQDLGDGYTAVYGQLKELNFAEGDMVSEGQVIGYVSEPTKYYVTEGCNVYFRMEKDEKAVNPKDYLPEMPMDTLD
ncbi:MAG: peptidoglycan DD-metalloendopeptidase family protein [Lachnospiraceae bacterium]|nr:peptidoglycan DD-metalloendopeptidase family protein [Lachnospiraceae bacterium]